LTKIAYLCPGLSKNSYDLFTTILAGTVAITVPAADGKQCPEDSLELLSVIVANAEICSIYCLNAQRCNSFGFNTSTGKILIIVERVIVSNKFCLRREFNYL